MDDRRCAAARSGEVYDLQLKLNVDLERALRLVRAILLRDGPGIVEAFNVANNCRDCMRGMCESAARLYAGRLLDESDTQGAIRRVEELILELLRDGI